MKELDSPTSGDKGCGRICFEMMRTFQATHSSHFNYLFWRNPEEGRKEMFYLTTHSAHFIYGYMASDIWLRTILIVRKETRCRHIGYSLRLKAMILLYAPSHRQDSTYHGLCYTSRGALAGTRNSSTGPPHEGSIRRPIALTTELHLAPVTQRRTRNRPRWLSGYVIANGLVGTGFASRYRLQPRVVF